jgi:hypothetical protein
MSSQHGVDHTAEAANLYAPPTTDKEGEEDMDKGAGLGGNGNNNEEQDIHQGGSDDGPGADGDEEQIDEPEVHFNLLFKCPVFIFLTALLLVHAFKVILTFNLKPCHYSASCITTEVEQFCIHKIHSCIFMVVNSLA